MFYRESGVFKTTYATDMALYPLPITKWAVAAMAVLFIVINFCVDLIYGLLDPRVRSS